MDRSQALVVAAHASDLVAVPVQAVELGWVMYLRSRLVAKWLATKNVPRRP